MSRLAVRIIPNASKSELVGKELGTWKIRLAAPPVDGKANDALIRYVADLLDCAPSEISIIKGHTSKHKILEAPLHIADIEDRLRNSLR